MDQPKKDTFHTFAVCAYGDSPYLETCLRSLRGQTVDSDIILCTSTPSDYIMNLAEQYQVPMYIRKGRPNIRDDWNFACERASGRYVTIAHQDDVYHKRYAEQLKRFAERWPDMILFTTDYITIRHGKLAKRGAVERIKKVLRFPLRFPSMCGNRWVKQAALMLGNPICCPSCAYHKAVLPQPLFRSDYKFALDWELLLDLAGHKGRFVCVEQPLICYRVHEAAATKTCIEDQSRRREETEVFSRLWPAPLVRLIMRCYQKSYDSYSL